MGHGQQVAAEPDQVDVVVVVDLWVNLTEDAIELEGKPRYCKQSYHKHQHFSDPLFISHHKHVFSIHIHSFITTPQCCCNPDVDATNEGAGNEVLDQADEVAVPEQSAGVHVIRSALFQPIIINLNCFVSNG